MRCKLLYVFSMMWGLLFLCSMKAHAYNYDVGSFNGNDRHYWQLDNNIKFTEAGFQGAPVLFFKTWCYNSYGYNDFIGIGSIQYKVEDIDADWTNLYTFQDDNTGIEDVSTNNLRDGKVKYFGVEYEGTPGFRHFWQKADWHLPGRAFGQRINIRFKYKFVHDNKWATNWSYYECNVDIPSIKIPLVTSEWSVIDNDVQFKTSWSDYTPNTKMNIQASGESKEVNASENSVLMSGLNMSEDITVEWKNYWIWDYTHSEQSGNIRIEQSKSYSYPKVATPVQLAVRHDICDSHIALSWNLNDGEKYPIHVFRKEEINGSVGNMTHIAELSSTATLWKDRDIEADKDYTYVVAVIPSGYPVSEFANYKTFTQTSITTNVPDISIDNPLVVVTEDNSLLISWNPFSGLCASSKLYLVKVDEDSGRQFEFLMNTDETSYEDNSIVSCVSYKYNLRLEANNKTYTGVSTIVSLNDAAAFESLIASKGVYNDKVKLTWTIDKPRLVEEYVVERKGVDDPDTYYQIIGQFKNTSSRVEFIDQEAVAGMYYRYRVKAYSKCSESSVATDLSEIGFALPYGTVSGRIQFKGGTAVNDVCVRLQRLGSDEIVEQTNRSVRFDGNGYAEVTFKEKHACAENDFSFQAYLYLEDQIYPKSVIADLPGEFSLWVENEKLNAQIGNAVVTYPIDSIKLKFVQVTVTANSESVYLYIDGKEAAQTVAQRGACVGESLTKFYMGNSATKDMGFVGHLDECRLWKKHLSPKEVARNYAVYLNGTERDLVAYWQFDENLKNYFFDLAHKDFYYYENNGLFYLAQSSEKVPSHEQLSLMAYTDQNGNYLIRGIPLQLEGTTYQIVPSYGTHQFEPSQHMRHLGGGGLDVINSVDFNDISSFRVNGTVLYEDTQYPVEDAIFYIDGEMASLDGKMVSTNSDGKYSLDVPIGSHFIEIKKEGHTFANNGRWPAKEGDKHNFQSDISELNFVDKTLVKLAGRLVGGKVQSAKPLGFGLSKNNLGSSVIVLKPSKSNYFLTEVNQGIEVREQQNLIHGDKSSTVQIHSQQVQINTNPQTGEFVAYLPPIIFNVESASGGIHDIPREQLTAIDLTSTLKQEEIYERAVIEIIPNPVNPELVIRDTTFVPDTFYYHDKRIYSYVETRPALHVSQLGSKEAGVFGEKEYIYKNEATQEETALPLYRVIESGDAGDQKEETDIEYTFKKPVFLQGKGYTLLLEAYEEYVNMNTGDVDRYPFVDGKYVISNGFAIYKGTSIPTIELNPDSTGVTFYSFLGGLPNITTGNSEEEHFANNLQITLVSNAGIGVNWCDTPMSGFLLGALPTGNNFVTQGPDQIITILRDPPGSNSFMSIEKDMSVTRSTSIEKQKSLQSYESVIAHLGPETELKTPFFNSELIVINDVAQQWSGTHGVSSANETSTTLSFNESFSTSADPAYVGAMGDVFIGNSTNILYGNAQTISIYPSGVPETEGVADESGSFVIGRNNGFRMDVKFGTLFSYTQNHIENYLIPNLKMLRNSFLTQVEDTAGFINNSSRVIYLTTLSADDERFGSDNDAECWGSQAVDDTLSWSGPSYHIVLPALPRDTAEIDSVRFFNQQIDQWEFYLRENEKEKLNASALIRNHSFDAGVEQTHSTTSCELSSTSYTFEVALVNEFHKETGGTFGGLGGQINFGFVEEVTESNTSGTEEESCVTYSYTLADENQGDYFSVDVFEGANKGRSPLFRTRAGQSSCPYEGATVTKYYAPGSEIGAATMRIEVPQISVAKPILSDIPGGTEARFDLKLQNASEVNASVAYRLMLDDASNPDGAILSIDGVPITGEGRLFLVEAGETLNKTLILKQSRTDIQKYENIVLQFASDCQCDPTDDVDDIIESASISAYFTPSSSDCELAFQNAQTLVNSVTGTTLGITLDRLQLDYINFAGAILEYKSETASTWLTEAYYTLRPEEIDPAKNCFELTKSKIVHNWNMEHLLDGTYEVRVRTISKDAQGAFIAERVSLPLKIRKDVSSPKEMGRPQPSNGVLNPGEDIVVYFNEDINQPMVTALNLSVKGELNGHLVRDNIGLDFAGENDFARTEATVNLTNKPFTIELWTKRSLGNNGVILAHGTLQESMTVGFDQQNYLHIVYGNKDIKSSIPINDPNWIHLAIVYNNNSETISAFVSSQMIAEKDREVIKEVAIGEYTLNGEIRLGKALDKRLLENNRFVTYSGSMNEVRIWNKAKTLVDISAENRSALSGLELGLLAYWPMTEGIGLVAKDKVSAKNMLLNTSWYVYPKGYAVKMNGVDNAIKIKTRVPVTNDNNYTIEGWFKGADLQSGTLFAYKKNIDDIDSTLLAVGFDNQGKLILISLGENFTTTTKTFLDNQWHHFALSVNRSGKANFYVDTDLYVTTTATKFPAMYEGNTYLGANGDFDFFKGYIDEIRIWNSPRTVEQIERNMNVRRYGDESGLIAYYPFEKYQRDAAGVLSIEPTLEDMMSNSLLQNAGEALLSGPSVLENTGVTIQDVRPEENVLFDYTVSDRAILISLLEPIERIENTVLEFGVNGIQDKQGNTQSSPITWTAYINLNTMRWSEKQISHKKKAFDPLSFEVSIVNSSGNKQNFAIDNLPDWITASEISGILQPLEQKAITFTVSEGLNIGQYEEIFYLKGGSEISAPLMVHVQVEGEKPNWLVNPSEFEYSMNLVGVLSIEEILSADPQDIIAAFDGEQCVGVASPEYIASHDMYIVFMTMYNNQRLAEGLSFRVWDASTGRIYPTVEPRSLNFGSDQIQGTIDAPVSLNALDEIQLDWKLNKGWNWVSSNVDNPLQKDVTQLLDPIKEQMEIFKGDSSYAQYYAPFNEWRGDMNRYGGVVAQKSYKVNMKTGGDLKLIGRQKQTKEVDIPLQKGWNYLGYVPNLLAPVTKALSTLTANDGDLIKNQNQFAIYYRSNGGWIGSLKYLRPGDGYMIHLNNAQVFNYPKIEGMALQAPIQHGANVANRWATDEAIYANNMSVVATLTVEQQNLDPERYDVALFVNNICRGYSVCDNGLLFISAMSNYNDELMSVKVYDKVREEEFELQDKVIFKDNGILGTPKEPVVFDLSRNISGLNGVNQGAYIYPTWVSDKLTVVVDGKIEMIQICDIKGKVCISQKQPDQNTIDVSALEEGNYFITVHTSTNTFVDKFVRMNKTK